MTQNEQRVTLITIPTVHTYFQVTFSSKSGDVPRNVVEGFITANSQTQNGVVYDKKPFKLKLEAGRQNNVIDL